MVKKSNRDCDCGVNSSDNHIDYTTKIAQSYKLFIQTPQSDEIKQLEKSAPTQRKDDSPLLYQGITYEYGQIFSNAKCIFKLATTYEELIIYETYSEEDSNIVKSSITYKRIPNGDPRILRFSKMYHIPKRGNSERFNGTRYDVYALYSKMNYVNNRPRPAGFEGYRLLPRTSLIMQPIESYRYSDGMYFVYEKTRR